MKAITVAGDGRFSSFFIQNHSLSCRRERLLTKQHEAKKLRHCEDACMPARRGTRRKADQAADGDTIRDVVRRTDANPQLVATARFLRGLIPGGEPETSEMPQAMQRLVDELQPKGPSAMREIGMGALQAWQALSEAQRRRRGNADVAILFTDLVGFSDWALSAGDEAALDVLRQVGDAEQKAVSSNKGAVVKRLGDGAMAVFSGSEQAVRAALESQEAISKIEIEGYRPEQRAGVHRGTPRKVKGDFLGVDVNIAARVGDAAKGGEVLVSDSVREQLDGRRFKFGRSRELDAPGAPADLTVCPVSGRRGR
jgi:adenylate cyclase